MSCRMPLSWFRTSIIAEIPSLRLSRSVLSVASSSKKSVDDGSYGSIHCTRGLPRMGERLPLDIRAKGDPPLVLSTTAMMPGDSPAMSPPFGPLGHRRLGR